METRDYANEPSPCQDGGEELMRTECACLGCMTERTSDFQKGSFTLLSWQPLRINFNAVDFVSPFLPSSFFLGFLCSSTHRHSSPAMTSEQTCVHVACQDPERALAHGRRSERWRGKKSHKRFITIVSNPLLHCQGDVIKHTL